MHGQSHKPPQPVPSPCPTDINPYWEASMQIHKYKYTYSWSLMWAAQDFTEVGYDDFYLGCLLTNMNDPETRQDIKQSKILACVFMIQIYQYKSGRHSYILSLQQHLHPHFHFLRQQKQHLCLHFHFLRNNTYTWWEAKEFCENNGGYLVEVGQNQPWFF